MSYTFDDENNFTVRYFVNGFSVYSQTGKYEIGDDRSTITFSFSTVDNSDAPNGIAGLSGEFFFKREDDQIWIGNKCYQKNETLHHGATDLQESETINRDSDNTSDNTEHLLSGGYTAQNYSTQMSYTFDKEKNVTVRFLVSGFPVYSRHGSYEISGDGATITFSFPTDNDEVNSYLPNGMNSISGAFSFEEYDDKIWIGNVCYQKDGTQSQGATDLQESETINQDSDKTSDNTEHLLSGGYTAQNYSTQMSYTFDKEKNVTVRFLVSGFPVYSRQGSYEISGDGATITFSFPTDNDEVNSYLPNGVTSISGAFSFEEDDDKIWIGNVCYQKDRTQRQDNSASSSNPNILEESVELQGIRLKLPEQYSISYQVTDESFGISQTYIQTLTRADEGIFLDLNPNERYVFELLDSGKYMQYRYNALIGKYETAMPAIRDQITAGILTEDMFAVDYSVVAGYTSRIENFLDYYEKFRSYAIYQGNENINGIDCLKFTASFDSFSGNHSAEFWVDPTVGICVKGIYRYQSGAVTKTFLCTDFKAGEAALPSYK